MTIKKLIFFERSLVVLNVVGSSPTLHPKIRLAEIQFRKGLRFSFAFYLSFSFSLVLSFLGSGVPFIGISCSLTLVLVLPFPKFVVVKTYSSFCKTGVSVLACSLTKESSTC